MEKVTASWRSGRFIDRRRPSWSRKGALFWFATAWQVVAIFRVARTPVLIERKKRLQLFSWQLCQPATTPTHLFSLTLRIANGIERQKLAAPNKPICASKQFRGDVSKRSLHGTRFPFNSSLSDRKETGRKKQRRWRLVWSVSRGSQRRKETEKKRGPVGWLGSGFCLF